MMKVIQHRFAAFRRAFGRDPLPHEPLFFVENSASPRMASSEQVARQLAQAAGSASVSLPLLLKFLGMTTDDASISAQ